MANEPPSNGPWRHLEPYFTQAPLNICLIYCISDSAYEFCAQRRLNDSTAPAASAAVAVDEPGPRAVDRVAGLSAGPHRALHAHLESAGGERSRHLRAGAVGGDAERGGVGPDAAALLELQREA